MLKPVTLQEWTLTPQCGTPIRIGKESVESQITSRVLYQIKVVFFQLVWIPFSILNSVWRYLDLTQVSCFNGIKDMHFRTRDVGGWYQLGAFDDATVVVVVAKASRILELRLEPRTTQSFESLVEEATF